jgi:N-acetylmuramoyl-L-alanine amidase CwlA
MVKVRKNLMSSSLYSWKSPYSMTPTRIVVHNTANDASADAEIRYMNKSQAEGGRQTSFHYAVDNVEAVQGLPENRNGWHSGDGNGKGNRQGIGIEICYSKSGGDRFIKAEQNAVELIVDILKRYGWGIDKVTKHQDYANKYCPHRTLDMGWTRFINMIKDKLNDGSQSSAPVSQNKNIDELAREVIAGKYGNGDARRNALGSLYNEVQARVNEILGTSKPKPSPKKSADEIAKEVINGNWGNGEDRKIRLSNAGYNYNEVQAKVNEILYGSTPKKSIDDIAREVIRGNWGNGNERKQRLEEAGYNYRQVQDRVNQLL